MTAGLLTARVWLLWFTATYTLTSNLIAAETDLGQDGAVASAAVLALNQTARVSDPVALVSDPIEPASQSLHLDVVDTSSALLIRPPTSTAPSFKYNDPESAESLGTHSHPPPLLTASTLTKIVPQERGLEGALKSLSVTWNDRYGNVLVLFSGGRTMKEFSCSGLPFPISTVGPTFAFTDLNIHRHIDERRDTTTRWDSLSDREGVTQSHKNHPPYHTEFPLVVDSVNVESSRAATAESPKRVLDILTQGLTADQPETPMSTMRVIYLCQESGDARVNLTMKVHDPTQNQSAFCLSFIKTCAPTWSGFTIEEAETHSTVLNEHGVVLAPWRPTTRPVSLGVTVENSVPPIFILSLPRPDGNVLIREIKVESSDEQILTPLLREVQREEDTTGIEKQYPIQIAFNQSRRVALRYQCNDNTHELFTRQQTPLRITMTVINQQPLIPPIKISWIAACPVHFIPQLAIKTSACNRTIYGLEPSLFNRDPVIVWEDGTLTAGFKKHSENPFLVSPAEICTAFTFTVPVGQIQLPPLHQKPIIAFDQVAVDLTSLSPEVKTANTTTLVMHVMYTCWHDNSLSPFKLTVIFDGSINYTFYWRKQCGGLIIRRTPADRFLLSRGTTEALLGFGSGMGIAWLLWWILRKPLLAMILRIRDSHCDDHSEEMTSLTAHCSKLP